MLARALPGVEAGAVVPDDRLDNSSAAAIDLTPAKGVPAVASIYQLDALVRRAPALQLTTDARRARAEEGAAA